MPRPRKVLMETFTHEQAHDAAIKAAIKTFNPYRAVKRSELQGDFKGWMVVYFPPIGKRGIVKPNVRTRKKAKRYADMLNVAWAEGRSIIGLM